MTTNSQLSTTAPKKKKKQKPTKQTTTTGQNHRNEITWRVISGEGEGRNSRGNVQGRRSIISRCKIDGER